MGGLALCSANEAKFNFEGFVSTLFRVVLPHPNLTIILCSFFFFLPKMFALATNLSEVIQNVLSKRMLSYSKYNPGEMQYHSGLGSLFLLIPTLFIFSTEQGWSDLGDPEMCFSYLINGLCFHFQTISAYALMDAISPVTHR